jgi:hypothetical protein
MKTFALLFVLAGGLAVEAEAQTLTYLPTQDAFVSAASANVNSNYGGAGALAVAGSGDSKGEFDSVLEFNLSTAAGLTIQSITLQFNASNPANLIFNSPQTSGQFSIIWMDNISWTEGNGSPSTASTTGGITDATLPNYLDSADETLGTYTSPSATSGANIYSLSITAPSFLNAVTSGSTVSFEVVPTASSSVAYVFNSKDFSGSSSAKPMLTIVAVPEPATAGLMLAALAAAGGWRRLRQRKG